MKDNWICCVRA